MMSSILMFIIATIIVGFTSARIANRIFTYQPLQLLYELFKFVFTN